MGAIFITKKEWRAMKDNVMYVTTDGLAVKGSDLNDTIEKVKQAWEGIKELLSKVVQGIRDRFERILNRINTFETANRPTTNPFKHSWHVPMSTVKHSQVISKRPMFAVARNNI